MKCAGLSLFTGVPHGLQARSGAHSTFVSCGYQGIFSGVKRPGNEAGHSSPARVEIKN